MWAGFVAAVVSVIGVLAVRALVAVGVGVVSYTGVTVLLDSIHDDVVAMIGGVGPQMLNILGVLQLDVATSILFSAIAVRFALKGVSSAGGGTVKRMGVS